MIGKHVFKGAERLVKLRYDYDTNDNVVKVVDDGHTLTIYTKDPEPPYYEKWHDKTSYHPKEIIETELSKAMKVVTKALKEDLNYRRSWVASIAMSMKDEHDIFKSIHETANQGAERFIDLLTRGVE